MVGFIGDHSNLFSCTITVSQPPRPVPRLRSRSGNLLHAIPDSAAWARRTPTVPRLRRSAALIVATHSLSKLVRVVGGLQRQHQRVTRANKQVRNDVKAAYWAICDLPADIEPVGRRS
jgi:hypothetical protein